MRPNQDRDRRIVIAPSETDVGCYVWVIRAHDGRCLARSPYACASPEAARLSAECWEAELKSAATAPDQLRVLIADDNMFYADALCCLLERERHEVVGVTDHAVEALAIAQAQRPNLALVDLTLRDGCSGPGLGRSLARTGVHVLFITATPHLAPAHEPGMLEVVGKPVGDARLLRAVAEAHRRICGSST